MLLIAIFTIRGVVFDYLNHWSEAIVSKQTDPKPKARDPKPTKPETQPQNPKPQ